MNVFKIIVYGKKKKSAKRFLKSNLSLKIFMDAIIMTELIIPESTPKKL